MLNTLSLSSDRSKIILLDNGKAHEFDLDALEGVVIGLIDHQLSVVTGKDRIDPVIESGQGPTDDGPSSGPALEKPIQLPFGEKSAFNIQFNQALGALSIIGATDMISTRPAPNDPAEIAGTCRLEIFNLQENNVRLRRIKNTLFIWKVKR